MVHTETAAQPRIWIPRRLPEFIEPQNIPLSGKRKTEASIAVKLAVPKVWKFSIASSNFTLRNRRQQAM